MRVSHDPDPDQRLKTGDRGNIDVEVVLKRVAISMGIHLRLANTITTNDLIEAAEVKDQE